MFQSRQGFFSSIPPVTKNLIIINLLFWLAEIVLPRVGIDLVKYLGLHYFAASDFNAVQLVTYMFMHDPGSFGHVFFNMFSVFMFGRTLEMVWGSKRFLIYYLTTGIGAGLVQEVTWFFSLRDAIDATIVQAGWETTRTLLNNVITIGASGAVFGILLAFGMLFPNAELFIMFIPIPVKAKYFVIFYGIVELFLGVGNFSGDNIAHFAHLGGMLFGFFLIRYWKKKGFGNGQYFW
ncbi:MULTISPECIES: rhomboid family intramembrane serine protease [Bacteroidales]|jgi:rhomboid family protein|uniref:rhomboid family intramembrane serine protease n=1 Tax=Bacteroidales TaxID=171549 RepID=UPI000575884B|nr:MULTISPECIES: rhomboid family intramembrane serine protease [Bacteroidales]KHM45553.1 membrane protein [Coprobacter secundus]